MHKAIVMMTALLAMTCAGALAAGGPSSGLPPRQEPPKCPDADPAVWVSPSNIYHIPHLESGRFGEYMCRSQADKKGAKPGPDVLKADALAAHASPVPAPAGGASPSSSPSPAATPSAHN